MKLKLIYFLALLVGIYSCKETEKSELTLIGTWNSIGYGQQINISDSTAVICDIYRGGSSYNTQILNKFLKEYFEVKRLTYDSLTLRLGFTNYDFVRLPNVSEVCDENIKSNDPSTNFDALWNTFNENYTSFELRGIDWQRSKEKFRPKLNSQSTDLELYNVLQEMTAELNDGHVSLNIPKNLEDDIDDKDDNDTDRLRESVITTINTKYIANLKTYNKGIINWGTINEDIGYIQINDFEDLADYPIDKNLSKEEYWEEYWQNAEKSENYPKDVLNGIRGILPIIFYEIKNTKTCIIDVRFNGGGFDQIGLEVLGYFTDSKIIAFSKKARFGNDFTKYQSIYIEPNGKIYNGNLYVLTSFQTASASETFVLASQNLKNVKTIGSNTEGILSDVLSKRLPNGWEYGLSNEIYENIDGINYEKNGIPADYTLNYSKDPESFYNNLLAELKIEDKAIEKVIEFNQ